jgi:hypothetical protein
LECSSRRISAARAVTRDVSGESGNARRKADSASAPEPGCVPCKCSAIARARSASVRLVIANGASVMSPSGSALSAGEDSKANCMGYPDPKAQIPAPAHGQAAPLTRR